MGTFKSGSSGGFAKLSDSIDGKGNVFDDKDREDVLWFKKSGGHKKGMSEGAMNVVVTRTVEVQSEDREDGAQLPSGDQVNYNSSWLGLKTPQEHGQV